MKNNVLVRVLSLFIGICFIITGVNFVMSPIEATYTIINWLGILLILVGVLKIIRYTQHDVFRTGGFLVSSILDIVLGVFIMGHNVTSIKAFTMLLGFWQLFSGISLIAASIDMKKLRFPRWWLGIITGAFGTIFGYLLLKDNVIASIYVSLVVGINLIIYGLTYISTFLGIKKNSSNY